MAGLASINIKFRADLQGFSSEMQNAMRQVEAAGKKMQSIGKNMSIALTAPIVALGGLSVINWDKQAKAIAQVEAGIKSTGMAAGLSSEVLQKMASDLQNISLFGDEEILKDVTAQMLTFTNVTGDTFGRAQQAVLDLATRLDGDLKGSAIQVGKALNDPVKGVTALSRVGVSFTEQQKDMIKAFAETGRVAEAQNIVLSELERQYGGSAKAAAEAGAGPLTQLKNILGDITEEFGKIIMEAINPFVAKIKSLAISFQSLSPEAKKTIVVVAAIVAAIGPLIAVIGTLMTMLPTIIAGVSGLGVVFAALTGPIGLVVLAIAGITIAIIKNWDTVKAWVRSIMQYFVDLYNESMVFRAGIQAVILVFKNLWEYIKYIASLIVDVFKGVVRNIVTVFSSVGELIKAVLTGDLKAIPGIIKNAFKEGFGNAKMMFSEIAEDSKVFGKNVGNNFSTAFQNTLSKRKIELPPETIKAEEAAKNVATVIGGEVEEGVATGIAKGVEKAVEMIKRGKVFSSIVDAPNISASANAFGDDKKTLKDFENQIQAWQRYRNEVANTTDQLKYADAEIAKLQEKMQMLENGGVTAFGNIKLAITETFDAMAAYNERLATSLEEMNNRITAAVENFIGNSLANIGEAIGALFSGDSFDLGKTMMQTLAGLLRQLGEIAIQTGIGLLAIKKAFQSLNPAIAIGAGVALIAFSSLISNSIKDAGAFTNGGVVGGNSYYGDRLYARVNSGELILNQKQQASIWNGLNRSSGDSFMGSLETKVKGEDLLIVLDRANKKKNRKG